MEKLETSVPISKLDWRAIKNEVSAPNMPAVSRDIGFSFSKTASPPFQSPCSTALFKERRFSTAIWLSLLGFLPARSRILRLMEILGKQALGGRFREFLVHHVKNLRQIGHLGLGHNIGGIACRVRHGRAKSCSCCRLLCFVPPPSTPHRP